MQTWQIGMYLYAKKEGHQDDLERALPLSNSGRRRQLLQNLRRDLDIIRENIDNTTKEERDRGSLLAKVLHAKFKIKKNRIVATIRITPQEAELIMSEHTDGHFSVPSDPYDNEHQLEAQGLTVRSDWFINSVKRARR